MSVDAHTNSDTRSESSAEVLNLPLDHILVDSSLQPRVKGINDAHAAVLGEVLDELPPIKVVKQGTDFVLLGGQHTLCAFQNAGRETIPAQVIALPEDEDPLTVAFLDNAAHGLAYTGDDRNAFTAHLLRQHPDWSDRRIGTLAGRMQPTVARIRAELEASAQIEQTETRVGRGGYTYSPVRGETRQRGELPAEQETIAERLFTAKDRREQRRLARYFERLSLALDDGDGFDNWQNAADAADACRVVLGDEDAAELGGQLGPAARNVLDVALALGYKDEA